MQPLRVKVNLRLMEMKEVLHILLNFMTGALPSDCLVSYPEHRFGVVLSSAEMQLAYSTASADWAGNFLASRHKITLDELTY